MSRDSRSEKQAPAFLSPGAHFKVSPIREIKLAVGGARTIQRLKREREKMIYFPIILSVTIEVTAAGE